jgi:hypothetical protein
MITITKTGRYHYLPPSSLVREQREREPERAMAKYSSIERIVRRDAGEGKQCLDFIFYSSWKMLARMETWREIINYEFRFRCPIRFAHFMLRDGQSNWIIFFLFVCPKHSSIERIVRRDAGEGKQCLDFIFYPSWKMLARMETWREIINYEFRFLVSLTACSGTDRRIGKNYPIRLSIVSAYGTPRTDATLNACSGMDRQIGKNLSHSSVRRMETIIFYPSREEVRK